MKRIFYEVHWGSDVVLGPAFAKRVHATNPEYTTLFDKYCDLGVYSREQDPLDYIIHLPDGTTKCGYAWADESKWPLAQDYDIERNHPDNLPFLSTKLMLLDEGQHPTDGCEYPFELARDHI